MKKLYSEEQIITAIKEHVAAPRGMTFFGA